MSGEVKALIFGVACVGAIAGGYIANECIRRQQELKETLSKNELELKKAELEGTYPPEYWTAKAAKAEADAKVRQAKIESEERLALDARNREQAEKEALRKFEQNAPAEYWDQKRIEEEEKTKRETERRRYEAEKEAAKLHNRALEESAKAAERAIKNSLSSYSGIMSI